MSDAPEERAPAPSPAGTAGPAPALSVRSLGRSYDGTRALDDLTFQVEGGEILGLVGPNGAGKTTALRTIAGVLPLREGSVALCGIDLARDEVAAKRCLSWVPDDPQPFDTLTVQEHLEFTAALYGVRPWRERAEQLLALFELEPKRHALGGELSRGMRQKLAFCCAWLPEPRVVLLDEPLSGLDPRGIRSARGAIRELAAAGTAVILSSHQLDLVQALAHRILILDRGRNIYGGTLEEARARLSADGSASLEEIFFAATESDEARASAPPRGEPEPPPDSVAP